METKPRWLIFYPIQMSKQLLVKAVIYKLFDSGLLPKAVVCDQVTTTQKVYKSFGVTTKSPFFFTKDRKFSPISMYHT